MSSSPSPASALVNLTIDGTPVAVPKGTLIIRAAERLGIQIPRFCDHPLLAPVAACRQCYVSVEGQRKLMTSCSTPVAEGMAVRSQFTDPEVRAAQEAVLEFLLINHPLDCPICDRGGECPLQDQALAFGPGESRYREAKRTYRKPLPLSPLVNLDRERCVLCQRCTRFCDEISGDRFIDLFDRGAAEQIAIAPGEDFDSPFSGNTIQICPVGALTATTYRFAARPFDVRRGESICTLCASGCNIFVQTRRGEVVRHLARENLDVNDGWLCDKGRFAFSFPDSPHRMATPLVRDRGLEPASFADAFDAIGTALRGGASRAAFLVGGRLADEDAYVLSRFARSVIGTNDVDARSPGATLTPLAVEAREAGRAAEVGYRDLEQASAILVAGLDAEQELPILHLRLRKAARRGGRIVVIHPRRTRLHDVAEHMPVLPGGEAALLRSFSAATDGPRAAFRAAAEAGGALVLCGPRLSESAGAVEAASDLASASGAVLVMLPRRAGERGAQWAGLHPALLPGGRMVNHADDRAAVEGVWGGWIPGASGRDSMSILRAAADREIEVLFVIGTDVLTDVPDAGLARRALENAPFKVFVDTALHPDVAPFADVALPACPAIERSGTLSDWEGRRQRFEPVRPAFGMSRPDWEIFQAMSEAFGADMGFRSIHDVRAEIDRLGSAPAGGSSAPSGDGDLEAANTPASAAAAATPADGVLLFSYPLLVDQGRHLDGADLLREALEAPAFVEVHPVDAARLGLSDSGDATITTEAGSATVPVRVSDGIAPGVAFVPWNNAGLRANTLFQGYRVTAATLVPAPAREPAEAGAG
jgi:NADH-quinone oxidoreductase subunit G